MLTLYGEREKNLILGQSKLDAGYTAVVMATE